MTHNQTQEWGHPQKPSKKINSLLVIIFLFQVLSPTIGFASPSLQDPTPQNRAQELLDKLTPEERVGQLFIIEFQGSKINDENPIFELITEYHIGGVILKRSNDNFTNTENILRAAWSLNQSIQSADWEYSRIEQTDPITNESFRPQFIPLFIAIEQDGNGYPTDQILSGMTPLPSHLAIGATWNPEYAYQIGEIMGLELSSLGFNLYLGPSLDVLETPRPERPGDLRTGSFGGSPYWVSLMGQSYISGLHEGSQNHLLVIGKHFPGYGGSDRPLEEDLPVIRKSLDQLQQFDLVPFFNVTGLGQPPQTALDGVLMTHAKYQGLQGTISPSTPPISFDSESLSNLFKLPEFSDWRDEGGLVISDNLGTRAVRRYFDPTEEIFNGWQVARQAFLAGNDLLYLGDFSSSVTPNKTTTIITTLKFFSQKYREDTVFAQRVDSAVLRILTQKFKLYDQFTLTNINTPIENLDLIGQASNISFNIASESATLIVPSPEDLNNLLPSPPGLNDRIVIITDTFMIQQCDLCPNEYIIPVDGLQQVILRLYGIGGAGQIRRQNLLSYTYLDLENALNINDDSFSQILNSLQRADWIVFIMMEINEDRPNSKTLRRFLEERPDLIQDKNTVAFAMDAPYNLDPTDISKLTAYYSLYSKQPQFIEIAARLLFKEITAPGSSPVSIPGIEYDLISALSPNPEQTLQLVIYLTGSTSEQPSGDEPDGETPTPTEEPLVIEFKSGDSITMETSQILDYNGRPVPNGTLVRFLLRTTTTVGNINQREVTGLTINGFAKTATILETAGILEIQATSGDPPSLSAISQFDVSSIESEVVLTPEPTENIQPEETPTGEDNDLILRSDQTTLEDWLLILLTAVFISLVSYQSGANSGQVRWGLRWALTSLIGGMLANFYLSFGFPGSKSILQDYQVWGIVTITILGSSLGWLAGWIWKNRRN